MDSKIAKFFAIIKEEIEVDEVLEKILREALKVYTEPTTTTASEEKTEKVDKKGTKGPNAYQLFYAEKKKEFAQLAGNDRKAAIKEAWGKLSDDEKKQWRNTDASSSSDSEKEAKPEKKERKAPTGPKLLNAYNLFMQDKMKDASLTKEQKSLKNIGAMWKALSAEQQQPWKTQVEKINAERKASQ